MSCNPIVRTIDELEALHYGYNQSILSKIVNRERDRNGCYK